MGAIVLGMLAVFSALALGYAGFRTIIGTIIIILLPFYLLFSNFNISKGEKLIFSIFAAIAIFPSLVYWAGFILPFRAALLGAFAAILLASFAFKIYFRKSQSV